MKTGWRGVGCLLGFGAWIAIMAPAWAQDLPVQRVVIYKNGVAYVERAGPAPGAGSVMLSFRAEDMTDILKSMSVSVDGGAVARVRFSTDESLEDKLKAFPFRIEAGRGMTPLLDALRGARIRAERGPDVVTGVIVSAQEVPATAQQPSRDLVTLLEDNGSFNTYEVLSLNRLRFEEPKLQQQMADYLRIVAEARNQELRSVSIDLTGSGAKRLSARYMAPMPVWKSSYRILFPETGRPVLEGWAVVDNTSGEDWSNVSLALVSGKPVSFLTNLYAPVHVERPFVELPGISAVGPITYESQMRSQVAIADAGRAVAGSAPSGFISAAPAPSMMRSKSMAETVEVTAEASVARESVIAETAKGIEAGALFSYEFPGRVNVRKGESVMLPFLQTPVSATRLLIYSDRQSVKNHPMLAFEMDNDSGLTLDGGPVTVFDGGEYAGEALFETTVKGEKRLLSYGVDLGTNIRLEPSSGTRNIQQVKIQRGVMTVSLRMRTNLKYSASNMDARAKTLLVERPVVRNYEVVSPQPVAKTSTANRFRVELPANGAAQIEIVEEYPHTDIVQLRNMNENALLVYSRNSTISQAVRQALEAIIAKQREIARTQQELSDAEKRLSTLNNSMERVRRNMGSLNSVRGQETQVQKLAQELGAMQATASTQEAAIEALRDRVRTLQEELEALIESTNA
jgi:chaperonin cofactor prefoldin